VKLIIYSHPHAGSTILRSMIGKCDNVHEIIKERSYIPQKIEHKTKITLAKWPLYSNKTQRNDHSKIILVRDPQYAIYSLLERFQNELPNNHKCMLNPRYWEWFFKQVLTAITEENQYAIRYRDIFDRGKLKGLCDYFGIQYSDEIYDQYPRHITDKEIPSEEPERTDHLNFRKFQINQKIENKNSEKRMHRGRIIDEIKRIREYRQIFGG